MVFFWVFEHVGSYNHRFAVGKVISIMNYVFLFSPRQLTRKTPVVNSKELGVLILTVEHNYICLCYYKEDYNNDMFRPYMWAIFRL